MRSHPSKSLLVIAVLIATSLACNAVSSLFSGGGDTVLLKDHFSDSGSGWGTGTDSDSSVEYAGGGLRMKVFRDHFFTWSNPDEKTYQNVHLEVTVKNQGADPSTAFGLICGQQTTHSYYYLAVTPAAQYLIGKSEAGKHDVFLTNNGNWDSSDRIAKNAPSYRLYADCKPRSLTLFVDGRTVDSASDTAYTGGGVGLFLWSGDNPSGEVVYDDFSMVQMK